MERIPNPNETIPYYSHFKTKADPEQVRWLLKRAITLVDEDRVNMSTHWFLTPRDTPADVAYAIAGVALSSAKTHMDFTRA